MAQLSIAFRAAAQSLLGVVVIRAIVEPKRGGAPKTKVTRIWRSIGTEILDMTEHLNGFHYPRADDLLEKLFRNRLIGECIIEFDVARRKYGTFVCIERLPDDFFPCIFPNRYPRIHLTVNSWRFPVVFDLELERQLI